jgi:hypothetical protein
MRHVPEILTRKDKTTRITKLIIKRRKDDTIRKIEVTERRDTTWYPPTYTYDELYQPTKAKSA